jgi:hypothetical protein
VRRPAGFRSVVSVEIAEAARDAVAAAQAALLDDHRRGAERQLLRLYELLVAPLDDWMRRRIGEADDGAVMSSAAGLLGLWEEILDVDVERESIEELLVFYAGRVDPATPAAQATTAADVESLLARAPRPEARFFRRLERRAAGSLGDRGHITVQRGAQLVLERAPAMPDGEAPFAEPSWSCEIGDFIDGDRLILRWSVPLPGQVAVLHAAFSSDASEPELSLLLPQDSGEAVVRRHGEVVEVIGEVSALSQRPFHALIVLWAPELLPPSWAGEVALRRRVPPDARLFVYRYTVRPAAHVPSA